jgi:hypothetical protein
MKVGGRRTLACPPHLAYGPAGGGAPRKSMGPQTEPGPQISCFKKTPRFTASAAARPVGVQVRGAPSLIGRLIRTGVGPARVGRASEECAGR